MGFGKEGANFSHPLVVYISDVLIMPIVLFIFPPVTKSLCDSNSKGDGAIAEYRRISVKTSLSCQRPLI